MLEAIQQPPGWLAARLESDHGWSIRLSSVELADFEVGLSHARTSGKTRFELTPDDFPFGPAALQRLRSALEETQRGRGFQLLRGLPVERWSVEDARLFFWGVGLHFGVPRPQGKQSQFMSDVRDDGGTYRGAQGRGYNTNSALDFHADGSDIVGLMCLRTALSGGESMIASSIAAHNIMLTERPDLLAVLYEPFTFSRQGEHAPEEPPYYQASVMGLRDGHFACRYVRNHMKSAQLNFPDIARLSEIQIEALDYFDAVLARPEVCFRMHFEPGDIQLSNNHIVLHSRTDYVDNVMPESKHHLLRLWLSHPDAQPLVPGWLLAYKDVEPYSLRGGVRGIGITPEVEQFESRLAAWHGMNFRIYADRESYASRL